VNKEWIDAAKTLGTDPLSSVICPECRKSCLQVMDVDCQHNAIEFERYLTCDACKAQTVMRMKKQGGHRAAESKPGSETD